ncbi:MAG TPA: ABC transporter permease [Thermodesulfobacteriota bacterium]
MTTLRSLVTTNVFTSASLVGRRHDLTPVVLVLPAIAVLAALFVLPLASAFVMSFHQHHPVLGLRTEVFTLANYARLGDSYHLGVFLRTIKISGLVTAICLIVGYPIAYFCSTLPRRAQAVVILGYLSPWLVSVVIKAYGWMVLLAENGIVNGLLLRLGLVDEPIRFLYSEFAIALGLAHAYLVFAILPIFTSLVAIDRRLLQAARNLGGTRLQVFRSVVLPLSLPGVVAGTLLVFTLTMAAFATPALLGGGRVKVVSYLAYEQALHLLNWPLAAAIGFVLMLVTGLVVFSYQRMSSRLLRGVAG